MDAIRRVGTVYPSGAPEITPRVVMGIVLIDL